MPSDGRRRPLHDHPVLAALGSVKVSLFLGMATAALLMLSSFFVPNPRGREALPFHESILVFFDPVSAKFWWFYLLLGVTFLYGVNGLVGTWRNYAQRLAARSFDRRFWGIFLMHVGFVLALVAHLVAGLGTDVEGRALLSSTPTTVAGRTARLVEAREILNPDGSLRSFTSQVDFGGGDVRTLAYNVPIFLDGFRRWILVQGPQEVSGTLRFTVDGREAVVDEVGAYVAGEGHYVVERISSHPSLKAPMVQVRRIDPAGGAPEWLGPGFATDTGLRFEGFAPELGLMVVVRRNDGLPLVFLSSGLFFLGLVLFTSDALRRRARATPPAAPGPASAPAP